MLQAQFVKILNGFESNHHFQYCFIGQVYDGVAYWYIDKYCIDGASRKLINSKQSDREEAFKCYNALKRKCYTDNNHGQLFTFQSTSLA